MNESTKGLSSDDRRKMRQQRKAKKRQDKTGECVNHKGKDEKDSDGVFAQLLMRNEDDLLNFVAKVNRVYQETLRKSAPFMTFVFCGMQSTGKSTIMERFMGAVLNIVQEGTGTRCPLDTTCIHDDSCTNPTCELSGNELDDEESEERLSMEQVFRKITSHNKKLASEDRFSTEPLYLIYRAKNVQNMRFVDTPGIISNKSTGADNRKDIENILRSEMCKSNTKLCVLLEPKEFATNPIIEFCDNTFGNREKWLNDATFLMTKFDKQLEDSRTSNKANLFFKEFHDNKCFPHLIITPTLAREDLLPEDLFRARKDLIDSADSSEDQRFQFWLEGHETFRIEYNDPVHLDDNITKKIGFQTAKKLMRDIMLQDTAKRLPEVLTSLRQELARCQEEESSLLNKQKFNDPKELKLIVTEMLWSIKQKVESYLDGNLEASVKFPDRLQTLDEEIEEEEESDWATKSLNHFTEFEDDWRDKIAEFFENSGYPPNIQAEEKFLGGKQVQRAIEFFRVVMIESLPDPGELRPYVKSSTGFLAGGLQRENWERSMVQLTSTMVKDVSHPGINYLIKHVGSILRRFFTISMDDIKEGEQFSRTFKLIPQAVEKSLLKSFDDLIWNLMRTAADKTHCALEPMYSTVDPNLPGFVTNDLGKEDEEEEDTYILENGAYKKVPEKRTSMVTESEIDLIIQRSFEYLVALMEFSLVTLRFQLTHYLYENFKIEISRMSVANMIQDSEWEHLIKVDSEIEGRLIELRKQIKGIIESLQEVQRIQRMM